MELSVISTNKELIQTLKEKNIAELITEAYVIDYSNYQYLQGLFWQGKLIKVFQKNQYRDFIKGAKNIIIDLESTEQIVKVINDWRVDHRSGLIITRPISDLQLSEQIRKELSPLIEIANIPKAPNWAKNKNILKYLVIGIEKNGSLITKLRKELSARGVPVLLVKQEDAVFIQIAINNHQLLKKAYVIELEELLTELGGDVELIKKVLIQPFLKNLFSESDLRKNSQEDLIDQPYLIDNNSIFTLARKKSIRDDNWTVGKVQLLQRSFRIKQIGIWGVDKLETIRRIEELPVEKIKVFTKKSIENQTNNLVCLQNLEETVKGVDLLIILEKEEQFAAVSLEKIGAMVGNKMIIDQANNFELEEMRAMDWLYISKGRPALQRTPSE